jgi:heme exporter protein D
VTVRVTDGRMVNTVVDRSIATPADVGRRIELRQGCKGGGLTGCNYGRPVARGWKAVVGALLMVEWLAVVLSVFMVVACLLRAVLSRRGYAALYDRCQRLQRPQRTSR